MDLTFIKIFVILILQAGGGNMGLLESSRIVYFGLKIITAGMWMYIGYVVLDAFAALYRLKKKDEK